MEDEHERGFPSGMLPLLAAISSFQPLAVMLQGPTLVCRPPVGSVRGRCTALTELDRALGSLGAEF